MPRKEHKLLRFLMPLLACVYGLGISFLCALPVRSETFVLHEAILSDVLQILAILFTLWLIRRPLAWLFPQVNRYGFRKPKGYALWLIVLATPLFVLLSNSALCLVQSSCGQVALHPFTDYAPGEIWQDLYRTLGAVLLAPVLEELCFRMMALAPIKRKGWQVVCALLVSVLFGVVHVRNMVMVAVHGLLFSLLFLCTGQVCYSICLHACLNLTATLLGVLDHLGIWCVLKNDFPLLLKVETPWALVVVSGMAVMGTALFVAGRYRERRAALAAANE